MADFTTPYTPSSSSSDEHRRTYRFFNPYESLPHSSAMPAHQFLYDLPTSPELLFSEEAALQGRTWGHRLGLYTGTAYLAGAALGAARGSAAGLRGAEPGESLKLRVNRVLNSSGQAGRRLGNSMGVLGLIFAGLESGISSWTGNDGVLSTVAAAVSTGAVYKAAAGAEVGGHCRGHRRAGGGFCRRREAGGQEIRSHLRRLVLLLWILFDFRVYVF